MNSLTIRATYINDLGEIVAQGVLPNGDVHTAVLIPSGDCDQACEQRIVQSQNSLVAPANLGSGTLARTRPMDRWRGPLERRVPGQR